VIALEERERIERIEERGRSLRFGYLVNYALAAQGKPEDALSQEQRGYEQLLGIWPHALADDDDAAVNDREAQLLDQLLSTIYRGPTSPAAVPPS